MSGIMSEKTLMYDETAFRVVIRDYKDGKVGKTLHNEIDVKCRDYGTFCRIVEAIQGVLNE